MQQRILSGEVLVPGTAAGAVLHADTGLSFMGGVNAATGAVIDVHHPLQGESVAGKILCIPSGRGSCSGSLVIFELLMNGHAPAALVFRHKETILTLGVVIAAELFAKGIPVILLSTEDFAALADARYATVSDGAVATAEMPSRIEPHTWLPELDLGNFALSATDRRFLAGEFGDDAKIAMRIVIRAAQLEGADRLIDIDMSHIDGCFYQGPAGLRFIRKLCDLGARVRVPTTMNAICVDRRQWRALDVPEGLGVPSDDLADAYLEMGVRPTYTCAPYLLEGAPTFGQQIAWAESNAVVFANSVLGARTMKYPDYLDILCAITGRAPNADCHIGEKRRATLRIDIPRPARPDDSFYPLLGYHIGKIATNEIPVLCGLEGLPISHDDLRAFGAAFATTSAAPMFHILGVTPEAKTLETATGPAGPVRRLTVTTDDLTATWRELNNATDSAVDLIALGNPHFSLAECEHLAALCADRKIAGGVAMIITCGRDIYERAKRAGHVARIVDFGARFLNDTCWCFIGEPVVAPEVRNILTNSGKYAHYGPAAVARGFHFGSLARCVDAACTGRVETGLPEWLRA
jgi:predicted aconitase/predicted aconitase with swiveling domain